MCPSRLKSFSAVLNLFFVPSGFFPGSVHRSRSISATFSPFSSTVSRLPRAVMVNLFQSSFLAFFLAGATRS